MNLHITLSSADWWALFAHFLSLSLLSIGGAITTAPDMHRYLVDERSWITHSQFTSSIALAQAAPGPNILFVTLLGWNVGINAAAGASPWGYGLLGVTIAMLGIMLPSTTLTFAAARWGHRNRDLRAVRAFKTGMAPVVVALLIATGWILTASPRHRPAQLAPLAGHRCECSASVAHTHAPTVAFGCGSNVGVVRVGLAVVNQPLHQPRWRTASYKHTPLATDTFRLSTAPRIGMLTSWSHVLAVSCRMPSPSAPSTKATGPFKSAW